MDFIFFAFIFIYTLLPNFCYRKLSKSVIKKFPSEDNAIALTFDDGPDPNYTPELLKVLRENDVKCTFFVIAERARKYPHLIKQIIDDGHYIGLHSLKHTNAIFTLPKGTKKDFVESIKIMDNLGIDVKCFRPPWGMFNPLTYYYAKLNNFKVILWSIHTADWSRFINSKFIRDRLINKVKPGDIVLLHNGRGAKDAPKRTINALKAALPALKLKGYSFVTAEDIWMYNGRYISEKIYKDHCS